ncbi:potassium transporter TrkA [Bacillus sp. HMF5848]|uniref:cation:proton antiporter regulatory subunit n=1 Tax=Bacillus sp. HMF5848 TaxID=2495421 RepID=UPI000F769A9E|nr:cation:proton antiporter regulatory subunit [Bacillus sp. HMF5848]RSK26534.1 potassium transporter TrkA [Bacillus sp. HMF5848]
MKIKSVELPGIGHKISFITAEKSKIVLIVHHSGKRDMYFFDDADNDEADFMINLNADETRELGAQLLGAMYQPIDTDKMELFKNQILIEWIEVPSGSPLIDRAIGEARIRTKTGASIIGIVKQGDQNNVIAVPDIDIKLHEGDTLMVLGKKEQIKSFERLCNGEVT